ncbi:MAG: LUD domain-containing protein [Alphaproteobacteria bacterium]|nr:LUD domain-containing protein [Alphaproteobacteria bacterium]
MSARDAILARIRAVRCASGAPVPPTPPIPARGRTEGAARIALFVDEAELALAEVHGLKSLADVPARVAAFVKEAGAPGVKAEPRAALRDLDWSGVNIAFGPADAADAVGLCRADFGIAETGTVVLMSGADRPTALNFLPDLHIVVLRAEDIVANPEAVWAVLKSKPFPRTVNWITGPSRTADIEQTMFFGAHGPRKLVILLIDEQA